MQRTYELMFIVRPDVADEEVDKLISTLEGNITAAGGTLKGTEKMGKRRLAYRVRKFQEGNYILITFEGPGTMLREVERRLRVAEAVIKFLMVRVDEQEKRLAKIKAIRATRVKRAPAAAEASQSETAPAAV